MQSYLDQKFDLSSADLVSVYDEFPVWSSYFGARILDLVNYKTCSTALDVGCGEGFPLIELAQRLGASSRVFGIDTWTAAYERIRLKLRVMNIRNVVFLNQPAEDLPFREGTFDIIVSNNGINNVQAPLKVLAECFRTLKGGGQFLMSVNLPGTMSEFYEVFRNVLASRNMKDEIKSIDIHIRSKRKSLDENLGMIAQSGFRIKEQHQDSFSMKFADGTAFLNHYFIKLAFLDSWKDILNKKDLKIIFTDIESGLNRLATNSGCLVLTIPFAVIDCSK